MDIVEKVAGNIYGIVVIIPVAGALCAFYKKINENEYNRLIVIPACIILTIISIFLIISAINIFIFKFFELPQVLKVVQIFLFIFYFAGIGGLFYALGVVSGTAGKSPSKIIGQIRVNGSKEK